MKQKKRTKIKRRIKWKAFFLFLLVCSLLFSVGYSIFNLHVKSILILGTTNLKDYEILEVAGLKEYPKLFKYSNRSLEKKIKDLDLVQNVNVKKTLFGKIIIQIEEAHVLFYNLNNSTYALSNGKETIKGNYKGVPFLDNYVKSNVYERLVKELAKINPESLALISEIIYYPNTSGDIVLDETRFLLRMNDGNHVHINLVNMDRLEWYALTYTSLVGKGTLYLDSDNENTWFKLFEEGND